eukprot:TRINITY_DN30821_c0_g1_i1.p1 TRINITY_DN30821_c0_g1~~TRINITY_DN30821_c0_g1_i1.p1  ORF type:complete len:349 (-),score=44.35 TRINITY_DN30821_c0_g1_i1:47-1093(-)
MIAGDQLEVSPFSYVLIPCTTSEPVKQLRFEGKTDDELRNSLSDYFSRESLTGGQHADFKRHLQDKTGTDDSSLVDQLISAGGSSFEIVPVVYPTKATDYVGTSLYIDQAGAFKELPLNDRASKIAQRPIRGDAFMLRCHDNEREDVWSRIDCLIDHFTTLHSNPPALAPDPQTQARLMQLQRDGVLTSETAPATPLSEADLVTAREAREKGNAFFKDSQINQATEAYSTAISALTGDTTILPEVLRQEADDLLSVCRVNRAACHIKLGQWRQAEADCSWILLRQPTHEKALYRRATANMNLNEFALARTDLQSGISISGADKLLAQIQQREKAFVSQEKAKYKGLFS